MFFKKDSLGHKYNDGSNTRIFINVIWYGGKIGEKKISCEKRKDHALAA